MADNLKALNAVTLPEGCAALALNFELPADGSVPAEIELIQAGQQLVGRDGRAWINDNPQGVVDSLLSRGVDLVVDFEHATELKAPNGDQAPAAGWVNGYEVRAGGAVWGKVSWTPRGQEAVANREYRYLSPVLIYEKATGRVKSLSSIGLVNKPNLFNRALNSQQGETIMWKQLLALLALAETATEEQAMNAVKKLQGDLQTALNRAETPSLDKFVPRADYDAAVSRAANAEQKIKAQEAATLETAINAEVDAALKAGKITPATKGFYVAMCRQDGGLDQFRKFVEAAPVVGDPSGLDHQDPNKGGKALNAEEAKIAGMFGNSAEDLKKYGSA
jgi:phage I-like protein